MKAKKTKRKEPRVRFLRMAEKIRPPTDRNVAFALQRAFKMGMNAVCEQEGLPEYDWD